jgi:PKD repeat protein/lysophospholipase L1-like esterase
MPGPDRMEARAKLRSLSPLLARSSGLPTSSLLASNQRSIARRRHPIALSQALRRGQDCARSVPARRSRLAKSGCRAAGSLLIAIVALLVWSSAANASPTITAVIFNSPASNPDGIGILGTGFGNQPPPATNLAAPGYTGYDYGNALYLCDTTPNPNAFCAGQNNGGGGDTIGLSIYQYQDGAIGLNLGSSYNLHYYPNNIYRLQQGDEFTFNIEGATCSGTVVYDKAVSCSSAPPPPPPPPPTAHYVALGDSYSSGEGVPPFMPGTDTSSDQCHRSEGAYSPLLVAQHAGGEIPATVDFWACSGSGTGDFYSNNQMWGEPPQLGRLTPDTTLITLSIGGNDIGFAHIGATCLKVNATVFEQLNPDYRQNCPDVLNTVTMSKIDNLGVASLFADIRKAAPVADVYVMGYPLILPKDPSGDCQAQAYREDGRKATGSPWDMKATDGIIGIETRIAKDDVVWMDKVIDRLNAKVHSAAAGAGFHFVDMTDAFSGHDVCSNNTDTSNRPSAHGLVLSSTSNDSPPNPSAFSFHPNAYGQAAMEAALYDAISGGSHVTIGPGQTQTVPIAVAIGRALLSIITHWPGSTVTTTLLSPSGQVVTPSSAGVTHTVTGRSESYSIVDPKPGTWKVQLYGADVSPGGEPVVVDTNTQPAGRIAPVAIANVSISVGAAPLREVFDGRRSASDGAPLRSFTWSFGDRSPRRAGSRVVHVYRRRGTYTVTLIVTDAAGRSDSVREKIVVLAFDHRPTPRMTLIRDPSIGSRMYFAADRSTDADDDIHSYMWLFGDGSKSRRVAGVHGYRARGTYTVTLIVTDRDGRTKRVKRRFRVS